MTQTFVVEISVSPISLKLTGPITTDELEAAIRRGFPSSLTDVSVREKQ